MPRSRAKPRFPFRWSAARDPDPGWRLHVNRQVWEAASEAEESSESRPEDSTPKCRQCRILDSSIPIFL